MSKPSQPATPASWFIKHDTFEVSQPLSTARRRFLGTTGRGALLALGVPALALGAAEAYGVTARSYFAGSYGLLLDGVFAGFLTGFSGGNVVGDVIKMQPVGADRVQRKRLGPPHAEPITVECGLSMAKPFYEWIKSSIEPGSRPLAKNGAVVEFDGRFKEMGRRNFSNATVTEVEFPSCDGSSKDPARLTVTFQPQTVALAAGSGATAPGQVAPARLLRSNFKLRIQGLEEALTRTAAIEAFDIKLTGGAGGDTRLPGRTPTVIDLPNLSITVGDSLIGQIYAWHQEFVLKGGGKPRPGVLDYLSPDLKSVLMSVNFSGLGIIKVAPEPLTAGAPQAIRRSKVEMYCEAVTVDFKA
jgi:hypothetical protein